MTTRSVTTLLVLGRVWVSINASPSGSGNWCGPTWPPCRTQRRPADGVLGDSGRTERSEIAAIARLASRGHHRTLRASALVMRAGWRSEGAADGGRCKKWGPRRSRLPGGERRLGIGQDGRARGGRARGPRSCAHHGPRPHRAGESTRAITGTDRTSTGPRRAVTIAESVRKTHDRLQATKRPLWVHTCVRGPGALERSLRSCHVYPDACLVWVHVFGAIGSVAARACSAPDPRPARRNSCCGARRTAMSAGIAPRSSQPRMHRSTGRTRGDERGASADW